MYLKLATTPLSYNFYDLDEFSLQINYSNLISSGVPAKTQNLWENTWANYP